MPREDQGPSFPAGTFRALPILESVSLGWNKERTAEQISVRMQIQDEWPDVRGKSIAWFGSFASQESTDITLKTLRTMGWDGKSPLGIPDGKNGCIVGLGGNEVLIVVQHQTYDGETRAKVAFVNPVGGMGFKNPLDGGALSKLNDRVRRHIGATAPRTAGPTHRTVRAEDALPARGTAAARPTPPVATRQAVSALASGVGRGAAQSDEDRLRAIDRGEDEQEPPFDDDDVPF